MEKKASLEKSVGQLESRHYRGYGSLVEDLWLFMIVYGTGTTGWPESPSTAESPLANGVDDADADAGKYETTEI
nr:hypothetical protein Itr_chr12CG14150 [Ipomoea trifida]